MGFNTQHRRAGRYLAYETAT